MIDFALDRARPTRYVVADRAHESWGPADVAIILLRKLWEREIRKLVAGEPLTQWRVPEELAVTIGL